jgi:toxin ParE1/3/4
MADADSVRAIGYLTREAGPDTGAAFVKELSRAYEQLSIFPASGSPRIADLVGVPGLRSWTLKTFHYLICYREETERVFVWRVLHTKQDLPGELADFLE